jgi:hypothetical protein
MLRTTTVQFTTYWGIVDKPGNKIISVTSPAHSYWILWRIDNTGNAIRLIRVNESNGSLTSVGTTETVNIYIYYTNSIS